MAQHLQHVRLVREHPPTQRMGFAPRPLVHPPTTPITAMNARAATTLTTLDHDTTTRTAMDRPHGPAFRGPGFQIPHFSRRRCPGDGQVGGILSEGTPLLLGCCSRVVGCSRVSRVRACAHPRTRTRAEVGTGGYTATDGIGNHCSSNRWPKVRTRTCSASSRGTSGVHIWRSCRSQPTSPIRPIRPPQLMRSWNTSRTKAARSARRM